MALELGSHPKPTQIAEALVYVYGYPTGDLHRGWRGVWRLKTYTKTYTIITLVNFHLIAYSTYITSD
jgi:hypothetical protein